jgi:tripartite-type tricarboxylate transporter receptor subunit TctC
MMFVIAGETQVMFKDSGGVAPQIKSGKVRALAVTSAQPSPLFPGLTTLADAGVPGYEALAVDAIVVPTKTPATIISRLNQEIVRALNQSDVKERLFNSGVVVVGSSPEELGKFIKSEVAKWGKVIKDADIHG